MTSQSSLSPSSMPTPYLHGRLGLLGLALCSLISCNRTEQEVAPDQSTAAAPANQSSKPDRTASSSEGSFEERLKKAESLYATKNFDEAWELAKGLLVEQPGSNPAIFIASRIMAARNNLSGAIQLISKIPRDDPQAGAAAAGQHAEWLAQAGEIPQAEALLRSILKDYPSAVPALRLLVDVLHAQGRRWDASKVLDRLVRIGDFTTEDLMRLVDLREPVDQEKFRTAFRTRHPDDPMSQLGEIRLLLFADRWKDSLARLESSVQAAPNQLELWVWYTEALLETNQFELLESWITKPPSGNTKHPEYWYIVGRYWMQRNNWTAAAKCFSESLLLDRRHVASMQSLAECLLELKQPQLALEVREETGKLIRIKDLTFQLQRGQAKDDAFFEIAKLYGELNDLVPSFGWEAIGLTNTKQPIPERLLNVQRELKSSKPQPLPLLAKLPLDSWTIPQELASTDQKTGSDLATTRDLVTTPEPNTSGSQSSSSSVPIALEDVAEKIGITAMYQNGAQGRRSWTTLEGIGGGVSSLDYDRDGWPDLYYSQAGQSPKPQSQEPKSVQGTDQATSDPASMFLPKQLYRSDRGEKFVAVEGSAMVADLGYGQGTGVADLDQDGFDDLLIANIGSIRWYRNQGDGTFELAPLSQLPTSTSGIWNSAIQAADLNGDTLPDIVQCEYIDGEEFLTRKCPTPANPDSMFCHPKRFPAGHTRIHFNNGDGNWTVADAELLESLVDGYALGALITNLDQQHGNDLFIANDVSPNHYLVSQNASEKNRWTLSEEAIRAGVAVDLLGRAQASMGIASGDQNRDGLIDLIVTNFRYEVSTLYLQVQPGFFMDATRQAKLGEPTLEWLSFGCQLSDIDNDGWLDFITVNGHIDYLDPWQMPPQVLRNQQGKFEWLKTPSPGEYFKHDNVGRSLTALDWNRDGKMDFAITHLDRPTAVLENRTVNDNRFLQLELIGTKSERNAIGAIVTVVAGQERWVTASTVGDGFYGTNQHLIHVGLGKATHVDRLEVRWPSGETETLENIDSNQRILWVEGQGGSVSKLEAPQK